MVVEEALRLVTVYQHVVPPTRLRPSVKAHMSVTFTNQLRVEQQLRVLCPVFCDGHCNEPHQVLHPCSILCHMVKGKGDGCLLRSAEIVFGDRHELEVHRSWAAAQRWKPGALQASQSLLVTCVVFQHGVGTHRHCSEGAATPRGLSHFTEAGLMQMQAQWVHAVFFERQHRIVKDHRKHVPPFHNESCTSAAYCFFVFCRRRLSVLYNTGRSNHHQASGWFQTDSLRV